MLQCINKIRGMGHLFTLALIGGALVLAAGYALRRCLLWLAGLRAEQRLRVQLEERTRIARTLHDTFLQGVQVLILRVERLRRQLPEHDPARAELDSTMRFAEALAAQGRRQLLGLRSEDVYGGDLVAAINALTRRQCEQYRLPIVLKVSGQPRLVTPALAEQICAIVEEALLNACRHAGGSTVTVQLRYSRLGFEARVSDDGKGIDPQLLACGGKHGHWGLVGMRERAEQIGAALRLSLREAGGTEVVLRLSRAA